MKCFRKVSLTIFAVILDDRYFILLHCANVRMGTLTCCTIPGKAPPSDVRPQPTAIPVLPVQHQNDFGWFSIRIWFISPAGSSLSVGKQTGLMVLENVTGFRSLSKAISWLYVFESKFLCRMIALTALIIACVSDVINWSWSPKITRILDLRNLKYFAWFMN